MVKQKRLKHTRQETQEKWDQAAMVTSNMNTLYWSEFCKPSHDLFCDRILDPPRLEVSKV